MVVQHETFLTPLHNHLPCPLPSLSCLPQIVTRRTMLNTLRNPMLFLGYNFLTAVVAVSIGIIYADTPDGTNIV